MPQTGEDPYIGREIAGFLIEEKLGEGGMGAVYKATQTRLERPVAFKILPPALMRGNPQFVERFLREAKAAARLTHPNVVQVYDAGESEDEVHYIAMEYVAGVGLNDLLKSHSPFSQDEALEITIQAAKGLQVAADHGVIHRDIKPANLMVTQNGTVKVADFGLAKSADADQGLTVSGQIMGTPAYMSPEQAEGEAVDSRSDIYSLGVTYYEMLAGRRPFIADSAIALIRKHVEEPVPDLDGLRDGLHPKAKAVVEKMLAKKVDDRQASFGQLVTELEAVQKEMTEGQPGTATEVSPPRPDEDGEGREADAAARPPPPAGAGPTLAGLTMIIQEELARSEKARHRIRELVKVYEVQEAPTRAPTPTAVRDGEMTPMTIPSSAAGGVRLAVIIGALVPLILLAAVGAVFIVNSLNKTPAPGPGPGADPEPGPSPAPAPGPAPNPDPKPAPKAAPQPDPGPVKPAGPGKDANLSTFDAPAYHAEDRNFAYYRKACPALSGLFGSPNLKHGASVTALALSPSATTLVAACGDGGITVWSLETGKELHALRGHSQLVTRIAYSRDGSRVLSASWDGTIRLWDPSTGAEKRSIPVEGWLLTAAISPDRKTVLAGLDDGTVLLLNATSGETVRTIKVHTRPVNALAYRPDGGSALTGGDDGLVKLVDLGSGEARTTFRGHRAPVTALDVTPSGRYAVSASARGIVKVWDLKLRKELLSLPAHRQKITGVAAGEEFLATCSSDGTVAVRERESGRLLFTGRGHVKEVRAVALDAGADRVVSGGADGRLRVWALKSGEPRLSFRGHDGAVFGLAVHPRFTVAASAGLDGRVLVWDLARGRRRGVLKGHTGWIFALDFSDDGARLASGGNDSSVRIWRWVDGVEESALAMRDGYVSAVRFLDGKRIAAGGSEGKLAILGEDLRPGKKVFGGHKKAITAVDVTADGLRAVTAGRDASIRLWDLAARRAGPVLWGHAKGVNAVALAPDGSCLLSGGVDGTLRLWSARGSGRALGRFNHGGAVTAVAFSPDGERYVSAGSDGQVKVWQSGSTDARAAWVPWPVNAVSFVFDGGTVLAAANNGVLALLDVSRMDVETGGK